MIFDVELFDFFAGVVPDVFAGKRKNSDRGQRAPGARLFAARLRAGISNYVQNFVLLPLIHYYILLIT